MDSNDHERKQGNEENRLTTGKPQVIHSQSDLDPKDKPIPDLVDWCQQRGGIVALLSGTIITTNSLSRDVQNCKTLLIHRGITPKRVLTATEKVINILLANIQTEEELNAVIAEKATPMSAQQQRLRTLVEEAVDGNISDIHIEVRPQIAKIRFRQYGELFLHAEWFPRLAREIVAVAFNKETDHATAHFNPLIPQDASMQLIIKGKEIRLRLASMPAHGGFDVVMRILGVGDASHAISLEDLGYTAAQVYIIKRAVQMPNGAILLSGPTGSGKTTTLASCMQLVKSTRKLYSIEDPVEKVVDSITQVPVNTEKDNRSFASFGRAALRMDPDYIVLGEIRDTDTARVMIRAAITGHLVFSTVHSNSSTAIITRLVDMGVSPSLLADANVLVALIFQRLIPLLCPQCKIPPEESSLHQDHLQRWSSIFKEKYQDIRVRAEKPCSSCGKKAITGRTVVAEVIWVDEKSREFIQSGDTLNWTKYLKSKGWKNYKERTLELVATGKVDPFDAETIMGDLSTHTEEQGFDYTLIV